MLIQKLKRMRPIFNTLVLTAMLLLDTQLGASQSMGTIINLTGNQHREPLDFSAKQTTVQVCGLQLGRNYQVWAIKQGCQPTLKQVDGAADFSTTVSFVATDVCMEFLVKKDINPSACSQGTVWFSIGCNDCGKKDTSQLSKITTQSVTNPQTLLNDIFLGGQCYEVSNLTAIGVSQGRGSFNDGNSTIDIPTGVILSTGDIADAAGPNNGDQVGTNIGGPDTDPDLNIYANNNIYDVQGIEFDFVPTSTTVSFEYVFASEEYCEYVNAGLSDLFGFFISGPGINGGFSSNGENIALVPNSSLYVTIDNINQFDNSTYFVPNRANCGATTNMIDIQFDGWTSVLTASATVVPCETYHIRLVIADVGDGIFDSAVFLGEGTFNAGGDSERGNIEPATVTEAFIEGCEPASFTFTRAAGSDINTPVPIELELLPSSTATPGIDFDPLPIVLEIPIGQNSITLPVNIIVDNIAEGTESINISIAHSCDCTNQTYSLEINDAPTLLVTLPVIEVCSGNSTTITAATSGETSSTVLTYLWSNGQTGPTTNITPVDGEVISVTVTDQCGNNASASASAQVIETPNATLTGGGGTICIDSPNEVHLMTFTLSGEPNWLLNYTLNGIAQPPILANTSPFLFNASTAGNYLFTAVSTVAGNCSGPATGEATINISDIQNLVETTQITCTSSGSMTIETTGGTAPYNYDWSSGSANTDNATNLPPGDYTVTVSDANGCTDLASGTITAAPTLTATATGSVVNCAAPNTGTVTLVVSGGTAPYNYTWSGGLPNSQTQSGLAADDYFVTISDAGGCTAIASASVVAASVAPNAVATANDDLDCEMLTINVSGLGSETGNNISYLWTGVGIVGANDTINIEVESGGTYTLQVTNTTNGCTSTASVVVAADQTPPIALAEGGTLTCADTMIVINGIGSSSGPNIIYSWTGGGIVAGGNSINPTVDTGGIYTLTVINEANGCTATAIAQVDADNNPPDASIAATGQINCISSSVLLDGTGSASGPSISYQWFLNGIVLPNANDSVLSVSEAGDYALQVLNNQNGCSETEIISVIQNLTAPVATATVNGQLDCAQNSVTLNGSVQGNPSDFSFAWSTPNGVFDGSAAVQNTVATAPGLYNLFVTNITNGCIDTASVQVGQSTDMPIVDIAASGNLDCNTSTVELNGGGSSQGAGFSFTWSTTDGSFFDGQNSLMPTIDGPGTYILTIFDVNNNCQNQGSVTVSADDDVPVIAFLVPPTLDCATNQATLFASIGNVPNNANLSFSWSTTDGEFIGNTNLDSLQVSAPGTYLLMVENDDTGCAAQSSLQVLADLQAPIAVISPAAPITCDSSTVTLNANGSSTGSYFTYQWTSLGGSFSSSNTVQNPIVNAPGTYNLLITNNLNHCSATQQVIVVEDTAEPAAIATAMSMLSCEVTELNLSGMGSSEGPNYVYEWTGPGVLQDETTLAPLVNEPGNYQLLVANQVNGCEATASVTVGENTAPPTAEAGSNGVLSCQATSLVLDGNGSSIGAAFTYFWSSPNGAIVLGGNSLTPTINAPGEYFLEVTDTTNGCSATDQVQITANNDLPPVVIAQAPALTCILDEVVLNGTGSATGPDYDLIWSTADGVIFSGSSTLTPTVTEPGTYQLTITNTATNCSNIATVTVISSTDLPAAMAGQDDLLNCTETTLELNGSGSASGPDIEYLWTTTNGNILLGNETLTPSVNQPGTYLLQVTNTLTGCTNSDEVSIGEDVNTPIAAAAANDVLDCEITTLLLDGNGSTMGNEIDYVWTTIDGNIVAGQNTLSPEINEPGTYNLTVTNSLNQCSQTASVLVLQDIVIPMVVANADGQITCTNSTVGLNSNGSSTGNNFSYQWSTSNGNIVSGANTQTPTVTEAGTYLLTISNNANGCSAIDEVIVMEDVIAPQISIAIPDELTCLVNELALQANAVNTNITVEWTTSGGNIVSGETTLTPIIDAPGEYFLVVTNNSNGCSSEAQTTVNENIAPPTANAGEPFMMGCNGQNSSLDGSASTGAGSMDYAWITLDGVLLQGSDSSTPTIGQPGTYQLTVTLSANGCSDTDEVVVNMETPTLTPNLTPPDCLEETGVILFSNVSGGQPPYLYSINGGNDFSTQPLFNDLAPGTYSLVAQDANGCSEEAEAVLEQPFLLEVDLDAEVTIDLGDSLQFNATVNIAPSEIASVEWTPTTYLSCADCLNPWARPLETISYNVTVVDKNGCEDSAPILVIVKKSNDVYVPNAFSPNDDGINDKFMVFSNLELPVKVNKFMVFSRWGESLYQQFDFMANDINYGWNGWHRGKPMDPAVFAWFAEVEFIDGSKRLLKGDVTLIR